MAHAEDYKRKSKYFDFASGDPISESLSDESRLGDARESLSPFSEKPETASERFSSSLERATACEENAQRLASLLERLEDSIRSVKLAFSAAEIVEQLLDNANRLLELGRLQSNPRNREALAAVYVEIINQIDGIAMDAEFNGLNHATGDILDIAFDNSGENKLKIGKFELTTASLGLASARADFRDDSEVVREMRLVGDARNTVATRKTSIEVVLSVLESRAKFAQTKLHSLKSASQALVQDGRALMAIQEIAARRIAMSSVAPTESHGISKDQVRNDNDKSFSMPLAKSKEEESDNKHPVDPAAPADEMDLETEIEELQSLITKLDTEPGNALDRLAMDLVRTLDEETFLDRAMKYERGESQVFVAHLAKHYGPELISKAKACYAQDEAFKLIADQFMRTYEGGLEEITSGDAEPMNKIDSCLKTDYGRIYILLARAVGMV